VKPFADLLPVLLFFSAYFASNFWHSSAVRLADQWLSPLVRGGSIPDDLVSILIASALAIIAITLQIGYKLIRRHKVGPMQWLTFAIFLIFGGATIYFHDDTFIKLKPTVLYWVFAIALFIAQRFARRNLMQAALEPAGIHLTEPHWRRLNYAWMIFFVLVGALNLFVAFRLSRDIWVSFKSFGLTGLTLAFAVLQSIVLARFMETDDPPRNPS
jgi:intracellular septation protein